LLSPRSSIIKSIERERPDLGKIVKRVPIRIVGKGAMGCYRGWHHWVWNPTIDSKPRTVEIFVEEGEGLRGVIKHEACHSLVMQKMPDIYMHLDEDTKDRLVEVCLHEPERLDEAIRAIRKRIVV